MFRVPRDEAVFGVPRTWEEVESGSVPSLLDDKKEDALEEVTVSESDPLHILPLGEQMLYDFSSRTRVHRQRSTGLHSPPVIASGMTPLAAHRRQSVRSIGRSLDTSSEDFSPSLLLKERYATSSFESLQSGLSNLKSSVEDQTESLRTLVDENLGLFLRCHSSVQDVSSSYSGRMDIAKIEDKLSVVQTRAHRLLQPLLQRREKAERIRSVLGLLNRFRFLFELPTVLQGSIDREEYQNLIHDYHKAKTFLSGSNVRVFQEIWRVVQGMISDVRTKLFERLSTGECESIDQEERIIRYLMELDPEEHPAWAHVNELLSQLQNFISLCNDKMEGTMLLQFRLQGPKLSSEALRLHSDVQSAPSAMSVEAALRSAKVIQRVCSIVQRKVPVVWHMIKFARSLSGDGIGNGIGGVRGWVADGSGLGDRDIATVSSPPSAPPQLQSSIAASSISTTKSSTPAISAGTMSASMMGASREEQDATKSLTSAFEMLETKIRNGIRSVDNRSESIQPLLRACVLDVIRMNSEMQSIRLPSTVSFVLSRCHSDTLSYYIDNMFESSIREVSLLYHYEMWIVENDASPTTNLPSMFKSKVMDILRDVYGLTSRASLSPADSRKLRERVTSYIIAVEMRFADCLHSLAFSGKEEEEDPLSSTARGTDSQSPTADSEDGMRKVRPRSMSALSGSSRMAPLRDVEDISRDMRWLLCLSNMWAASRPILLRFRKAFREIFGDDLTDEERSKVESALEVFKYLETLLLNSYISKKLYHLCDDIERGILMSGMEWMKCGEPVEVRQYMLEVVLQLVLIHGDVLRVSRKNPAWPKVVFGRILEGIVETFRSSVMRIHAMNMNGASQLTVEMEYLVEAMESYHTPRAEQTIRSIESYVRNCHERFEGVMAASSEFAMRKKELERRREALRKDVEYQTRMELMAFGSSRGAQL